MTRPRGERVKPEDVMWIEGTEEQDQECSEISSETMIYRIIESNCQKGFLTSARIIKQITGLGRTSIRFNLNNMLKKELVFRKFAVAKTGNSKTILPFYVTGKYKKLLLNVEKILKKTKNEMN